jgi:hypothetical protein
VECLADDDDDADGCLCCDDDDDDDDSLDMDDADSTLSKQSVGIDEQISMIIGECSNHQNINVQLI